MEFSHFQEFLSYNSTHSDQGISVISPLLMTYIYVYFVTYIIAELTQSW